MSEINSEFLNFVETEIRRHAPFASSRGDLLRRLPGIYPKLVHDTLVRIGTFEHLGLHSDQQHERYRPVLAPSRQIALPVPHPLDYDWRYSPATQTFLLERCCAETLETDHILLLGTPTLLKEAIRKNVNRPITLCDRNAFIPSSFQNIPSYFAVKTWDAFKQDPQCQPARVIVADPPWYQEHTKAFLWAASSACLPGGTMLLSVAPVGTRPNVIREREEFINFAAQIGLRYESIEQGVLTYTSPPFELEALHADNFFDFPEDWRRGDLMIFRKDTLSQVAKPHLDIDGDGEWQDEEFFGTRIRLREKPLLDVAESPQLCSIVSGDVLPTISRRDPRRHLVDVWTAGNRVYRTEGQLILRRLIKTFNACRSPEKTARLIESWGLNESQQKSAQQTISKLWKIAKIESFGTDL